MRKTYLCLKTNKTFAKKRVAKRCSDKISLIKQDNLSHLVDYIEDLKENNFYDRLDVVSVFCKLNNLKDNELKKHTRLNSMSYRSKVYFILYYLCECTTPLIGQMFKRNKSTIFNSISNLELKIIEDSDFFLDFKKQINNIKDELL